MSNLREKANKEYPLYDIQNSISKTDEYNGNEIQFIKRSAFQNGYELCKKEYEEKLRWIPVEERLPEFDNSKYPNGDFEKYEVKFCTGGISPKCFIQISHLIREDKFSGEFDWTRATHWRRIPFL